MDAEQDSPEGERLDVLTTLVEAHEYKHCPMELPAPLEAIKFEMERRGHWDVKKLAGRQGYRLRIGGYRGIYKFEDEQITVLVLDVGPRGGIYK
ncbi:MAG: hypothetical protein WD994_05130 [Pseudomonadales bacterium]